MDGCLFHLLLGDPAQDVGDRVVNPAFVFAHEVEQEGHFGGQF